MLRVAVSLAAAVLASCSNPNEPPTSPDMTGGWSGQRAQEWTSVLGSGGRECTEVWIISGQNVTGEFTGSVTSTGGGGCAFAGFLSGHVDTFGNVLLEGGFPQGCFFVGGSATFSGLVSGGGNLTARRNANIRCPTDAGLLDYRMLETYTMSKR